ncbi:MAG TPA: response regulator [Acidobacteriaceae bacterium]|nr:response regulator [Acidobacteriaceae bacterium]
MILVVDDNPVQALTRTAILSRAGHAVSAVYSAEDAFQALENDEAHRIGLVITDHIMPGESGSHFIQLLWQRRPGIKVMVLSGLAEAEAEYKGLEITFRAKPIMPEELISLVNRICGPS